MAYCMICFLLQAQIDYSELVYAHANHDTVRQYEVDKRYEHLVLASSFSKDEIVKLPFTDRRIVKIDLVYTTFSETPDFDQKELDLARLRRLIAINPNIVNNTFFEWNVIAQTGCSSSASCLKFFHGFVIYYEDYFTRETAEGEIDSIQTDLRKFNGLIQKRTDLLKVAYKRIECEYPESTYSQDYLSEELEKRFQCAEKYKGRVFFEATMDYKGRTLDVDVKGRLFPCPDELERSLKSILRWKRGLIIGKRQYNLKTEGYVVFPLKSESINFSKFLIEPELIESYHMLQQHSQCVAYDTDTSFIDFLPVIDQRVVSNTLQRNQWTPDLFVVDVTGSMYPFSADLLKWIRLTKQDRPTNYVFFNDGNDLPTKEKKIGTTGGLYHISSNSFTEIRNVMFESMRAGGGGDLPENNIEALLYGIQKTDVTNPEVVMITDNHSYPRDAILLNKYVGSLKIILCHTDRGIHSGYLDIARRKGFTLHTLNRDVENFGDRVEIDGVTYRWTVNGYVRSRY